MLRKGKVMRFQLVILEGNTTLLSLEGVQLEDSRITMADVAKCIETEAFLERLFGKRFHILEG